MEAVPLVVSLVLAHSLLIQIVKIVKASSIVKGLFLERRFLADKFSVEFRSVQASWRRRDVLPHIILVDLLLFCFFSPIIGSASSLLLSKFVFPLLSYVRPKSSVSLSP